MSEIFNLDRLEQIRGGILIIGDNAKLEGAFIRGEWHFLMNGERVTHYCSMPKHLELSEQNAEARLQYAKHLYRLGAGVNLKDANGDTQLALLQKLLAPLPFYMELSEFGKAYQRAYAAYGDAVTDTPERQKWWDCLVAIQQIAFVRFGTKAWRDFSAGLHNQEAQPYHNGENDNGMA